MTKPLISVDTSTEKKDDTKKIDDTKSKQLIGLIKLIREITMSSMFLNNAAITNNNLKSFLAKVIDSGDNDNPTNNKIKSIDEIMATEFNSDEITAVGDFQKELQKIAQEGIDIKYITKEIGLWRILVELNNKHHNQTREVNKDDFFYTVDITDFDISIPEEVANFLFINPNTSKYFDNKPFEKIPDLKTMKISQYFDIISSNIKNKMCVIKYNEEEYFDIMFDKQNRMMFFFTQKSMQNQLRPQDNSTFVGNITLSNFMYYIHSMFFRYEVKNGTINTTNRVNTDSTDIRRRLEEAAYGKDMKPTLNSEDNG